MFAMNLILLEEHSIDTIESNLLRVVTSMAVLLECLESTIVTIICKVTKHTRHLRIDTSGYEVTERSIVHVDPGIRQ